MIEIGAEDLDEAEVAPKATAAQPDSKPASATSRPKSREKVKA
jgi:hypothetical protein